MMSSGVSYVNTITQQNISYEVRRNRAIFNKWMVPIRESNFT